jgi:hypothetical protein
VGGTTLVATAIANQDAATLVNKWVLITSGANDGEPRRITSISGSTITVASAFTAQVASTVTFEVLAIDPSDVHVAINSAGRELFPHLYTPVSDESLIVDGLLINPSFSTFASGAFDNWTNIGTPTLDLTSTGSASITASGGTEGIEQNVFDVLSIKRGGSVHLRGAWMFASAPNTAVIRITFDGTTYAASEWHPGDGRWHFVSFTVSLPTDATEATISAEVTDGNVAEFDLFALCAGPIVRYPLPSDIITSPHSIYQQRAIQKPWADYDPLTGSIAPKSGHVLRLVTRKGVGELQADSDFMQVLEPRTSLVVQKATAIVHRILASKVDGARRDFHVQEHARAEESVARLLMQPGMRMHAMAAQTRTQWRFLSDEGGLWIELQRGRG